MTAVAGAWWRQLPHDGDPLWLATPAPDGRWLKGTRGAAIYLADEPETAWAEWYRSLAELGLPPTHAMPRDLWRYEVRVRGVADLSTARRLARHGLKPPDPTRRGWLAFQAVGAQLLEDGKRGVLYPSAARSGRLALCLFRKGAEIPGVTPVRPPETHREPPAPPRGLRA